ncbi:MAG: DUF1697 domain-containing protein [Chthoniobacterales bacterium]
MPRYVAFLRAINVGGHVVKMERLRGLFAEMGFAKVETFIASGNVIFETRAKSADALETKIEHHLNKALGFEVATMVRGDSELARIAATKAFPPEETGVEGAAVYVAFLKTAPTKGAAEMLNSHEGTVDEFKVRGREIHWLCRKRFSDSEFSGAKLEKLLRMPITVRNTTTVQKVAALMGSGSARLEACAPRTSSR